MSLSSNTKGAVNDSVTKGRYKAVRAESDKFCFKTYFCYSVSLRIFFHSDLQVLLTNVKKLLNRYFNAGGIFLESTGPSFEEVPAFSPLHLLRMFVWDKDFIFNISLLLQLRRLSG